MRADLTLAFIALIWGTTFVLVKRALDDISPFLYLALRFTLAAMVLGIYFRKRIAQGISRRDIGIGMVVGAVLMSGYVMQTVGLQTTTPSKSAFLTGLYVVLVPFAAAIVYQVRPRWAEVAGVAIAGPSVRITPDRYAAIGELLVRTADELEARITSHGLEEGAA